MSKAYCVVGDVSGIVARILVGPRGNWIGLVEQ